MVNERGCCIFLISCLFRCMFSLFALDKISSPVHVSLVGNSGLNGGDIDFICSRDREEYKYGQSQFGSDQNIVCTCCLVEVELP